MGGVARYALAEGISQKFGNSFPYGILLVNLSGCFFIGVLYSLAEAKLLLGPRERLLLMTGFCGAFTTFSTLILETSLLMKGGEMGRAILNIAVSLIAGLALFRIGEWLGKTI